MKNQEDSGSNPKVETCILHFLMFIFQNEGDLKKIGLFTPRRSLQSI